MKMMQRFLALVLAFAMLMPNLATIASATELETPQPSEAVQEIQTSEPAAVTAVTEEEEKTEEEPEAQPEADPPEAPGEASEAQPEESPEAQPEESPEAQPEESPEAQPEESPEADSESQPDQVVTTASDSAAAAQEEASEETEAQPQMVWSTWSLGGEDLGYTDEEAFAAYFEAVLYGRSVSPFGTAAREHLSDTSKVIYDQLVPQIKAVASGQQASALMSATYTSTSAEPYNEWGVLVDALLSDLPYELYWFDKVRGVGCGLMMAGDAITLTLMFEVADSYTNGEVSEMRDGAGNVLESYTTGVNTAKTGAVQGTVAAAQAVVNANADKSDYDKLTAYADYIMDAVSYDSAAAAGGDAQFMQTIDPWQVIYVFDGNTATNVVCEGYAKAFQYLCDLTWPNAEAPVRCISVAGYMVGSTGEPHMWNIVRIGGQNYLVDVTNSEVGTAGEDGSLFLAGALSGSVASGYNLATPAGDFSSYLYGYSEDTIDLWATADLTLADTAYDPENAPVAPPVETAQDRLEAALAAAQPTDLVELTEDVYIQDEFVIPEGSAALVIPEGKTLGIEQGGTVTANRPITIRGGTLDVVPGGTLNLNKVLRVITSQDGSGNKLSATLRVNGSINFGDQAAIILDLDESYIQGNVPVERVQGEIITQTIQQTRDALNTDMTYLSFLNVYLEGNQVLDGDLECGEGKGIFISHGASLTIPQGTYLNCWGSLTVGDGGTLKVEGDGGLVLHGEQSIFNGTAGNLDIVKAGVNRRMDNGNYSISGLSNDQIYATWFPSNCAELLSAIAQVESEAAAGRPYGFAELIPNCSFELTEDVTIPDGVLLQMWNNGVEDTYTLTIPQGKTLTNNGGIILNASTRIVARAGSEIVNNGHLTLASGDDGIGILHLAEDTILSGRDVIDEGGEVILGTLLQSDLVGDLAAAEGRGYVLSSQVTLTQDLTVENLSGFYIDDMGSITVPNGVTLTLNSYTKLLGGKIMVEAGGTLTIHDGVEIADGLIYMANGSTHDGEGWLNGWFTYEEETQTPFLSIRWGWNDGQGWYLNRSETTMDRGCRLVPGQDMVVVMFLNTWNAEKMQWDQVPVHPNQLYLDEGVGDAIRITTAQQASWLNEVAPSAQDLQGYFFQVTVPAESQHLWHTTQYLNYDNETRFPIEFERNSDFGFFSQPSATDADYLLRYLINPLEDKEEYSFYFVFTRPGYHVADMSFSPADMLADRLTLSATDNPNVWKFTVAPDYAKHIWERGWFNFSNTITIVNDNDPTDTYTIENYSFDVDAVWPDGHADASFGIDGQWYNYFDNLGGFVQFSEYGPVAAQLPEGVTYLLHGDGQKYQDNTLILNNAHLSWLQLGNWNTDMNGNIITEGPDAFRNFPSDHLHLYLIGENSIVREDGCALDMWGNQNLHIYADYDDVNQKGLGSLYIASSHPNGDNIAGISMTHDCSLHLYGGDIHLDHAQAYLNGEVEIRSGVLKGTYMGMYFHDLLTMHGGQIEVEDLGAIEFSTADRSDGTPGVQISGGAILLRNSVMRNFANTLVDGCYVEINSDNGILADEYDYSLNNFGRLELKKGMVVMGAEIPGAADDRHFVPFNNYGTLVMSGSDVDGSDDYTMLYAQRNGGDGPVAANFGRMEINGGRMNIISGDAPMGFAHHAPDPYDPNALQNHGLFLNGGTLNVYTGADGACGVYLNNDVQMTGGRFLAVTLGYDAVTVLVEEDSVFDASAGFMGVTADHAVGVLNAGAMNLGSDLTVELWGQEPYISKTAAADQRNLTMAKSFVSGGGTPVDLVMIAQREDGKYDHQFRGAQGEAFNLVIYGDYTAPEFQAAMEAVPQGETFVLDRNMVIDRDTFLSRSVEIPAGITLTVTEGGILNVLEGDSVKIYGTLIFENGAVLNSNGGYIGVKEFGTLYFENGAQHLGHVDGHVTWEDYTAPYLSTYWVHYDEAGGDESQAGYFLNHEYHENQEAWVLPGQDRPWIFFYNQWDADNRTWNRTPVNPAELELSSNLSYRLMKDEEYFQARPDQLWSDYFTEIHISPETPFDPDENAVEWIAYNGAIHNVHVDINNDAGFYTSEVPSKPTFFEDYQLTPLDQKDHIFYFHFTQEGHHITNLTFRNEAALKDKITMTQLDDNTWMFQLTEDYVRNVWREQGMNVTVDYTVVNDQNGETGRRDTGIWVDAFYPGQPEASFHFNDTYVQYHSELDALITHNGEYYDLIEVPQGLSYDYDSNTLTLDNVKDLSFLALNYAWYDENTGDSGTEFPGEYLTLNLIGENTITVDAETASMQQDPHRPGLVISGGLNVTVTGGGSLDIVGVGRRTGTWDDGTSYDMNLSAIDVSPESSLTLADATLTLDGADAYLGGRIFLNGGTLQGKNHMFLYADGLLQHNFGAIDLDNSFLQINGTANICSVLDMDLDETVKNGFSGWEYGCAVRNHGLLRIHSGADVDIDITWNNPDDNRFVAIGNWNGFVMDGGDVTVNSAVKQLVMENCGHTTISGGTMNLNGYVGYGHYYATEYQGYGPQGMYLNGGTLNIDGQLLGIDLYAYARWNGGTTNITAGGVEGSGAVGVWNTSGDSSFSTSKDSYALLEINGGNHNLTGDNVALYAEYAPVHIHGGTVSLQAPNPVYTVNRSPNTWNIGSDDPTRMVVFGTDADNILSYISKPNEETQVGDDYVHYLETDATVYAFQADPPQPTDFVTEMNAAAAENRHYVLTTGAEITSEVTLTTNVYLRNDAENPLVVKAGATLIIPQSMMLLVDGGALIVEEGGKLINHSGLLNDKGVVEILGVYEQAPTGQMNTHIYNGVLSETSGIDKELQTLYGFIRNSEDLKPLIDLAPVYRRVNADVSSEATLTQTATIPANMQLSFYQPTSKLTVAQDVVLLNNGLIMVQQGELNVQGSLTNNGDIVGLRNYNFADSSTKLNVSGTLYNYKNMDLMEGATLAISGKLNNYNRLWAMNGGAVVVEKNGLVTNRGELEISTNASLTIAGTLDNYRNDQLYASVNTTRGTIVLADGGIVNNYGEMNVQATGRLTVETGAQLNIHSGETSMGFINIKGEGVAEIYGTMNNDGYTAISGDVNLYGTMNHSGVIEMSPDDPDGWNGNDHQEMVLGDGKLTAYPNSVFAMDGGIIDHSSDKAVVDLTEANYTATGSYEIDVNYFPNTNTVATVKGVDNSGILVRYAGADASVVQKVDAYVNANGHLGWIVMAEDGMVIPAGTTVTVPEGSYFHVLEGANVTLSGTMDVKGMFRVFAYQDLKGTFTVSESGKLYLNDSATAGVLSGAALVNNGYMEVKSGNLTTRGTYTQGANGSRIIWNRNGGSLNITGSGKIPAGANGPWNQATVTQLKLGAGITSIGANAFDATSIVSVTIPKTVTSIGANAFPDGISMKGGHGAAQTYANSHNLGDKFELQHELNAEGKCSGCDYDVNAVKNTVQEVLKQETVTTEQAKEQVETIKQVDTESLKEQMEKELTEAPSDPEAPASTTTELIQQLEEKIIENGDATVSAGVAEEVTDTKIVETFQNVSNEAIVGALANAKETQDPAVPTEVKLVIAEPKTTTTEHLDETKYDTANESAVLFSMTLEGVEDASTLAIPVKITLPVPAGVDTSKLVILHYHDGAAQGEELPYTLSEDGKTVSFILTGFSDFWIGQENDTQIEPDPDQPEQPGGMETFNLYGSNMTLGGTLAMNFFFQQNKLTEPKENYYAVIRKNYADGRDDMVVTIMGEDFATQGSLYKLTFNNIAAKEMCDQITVTIFRLDGTQVSNPWVDSPVKYAMRGLTNANTTEKQKPVFVNMLNYGAGAQILLNYNTGNLANAVLTEEMLEKYTIKSVECVSNQIKEGIGYGTELAAEDKLVMKLYFNNIPEGATAKVTFTNHNGTPYEIHYAYEDIIRRSATSTLYGVHVGEIAVADGRQMVTCELYDKDGNTIGRIVDSIEGYTARAMKGSTADKAAQFESIMKFCQSAYDYFH